jgi:hypothetical protein
VYYYAPAVHGLLQHASMPLYRDEYIIHDRDTKDTDSFGDIFRSAGIKPLNLSARSPNLHALAEHFVKSIKTEFLDHMTLFGEKSLRHCVRECAAH